MADTNSNPAPPPYPPPPEPERSSFEDRVGVHQFAPKSSVYGYLPQINQWAQQARKTLEWRVVRAGGKDHIPDFEATPALDGEVLEAYKRKGPSKKTAQEAAAEAMALSGHC